VSTACPSGAPRRVAGGSRLPATVAAVLRAGLQAGGGAGLCAHARRVVRALVACGTPELGGHCYRCEDCGAEHFVPHSCRNRHCPRCQRHLADAWLEREREQLLPVPYFHVVFTLPHALNPLIRQNRAALYRLLFASASGTLLAFGRRRFGGQIGITAVLHTWGQNLSEHYHLHCLVTAGALSDDRQRFRCGSARFLFPVQALSVVFQARFRDGLWDLQRAGKLGQAEPVEPSALAALLLPALARPWTVYAKRPFAGPAQVLAYLGRYTHRVAIGSGRIRALDLAAHTVTFAYKDYADQHRQKLMTLSTPEFLRRFCLHILPPRFVKIRHYGLLGNHQRKAKLAAARAALPRQDASPCILPDPPSPAAPSPRDTAPPAARCPGCGSLRLRLINHLLPERLDSS
jgi:hypothetical protein